MPFTGGLGDRAVTASKMQTSFILSREPWCSKKNSKELDKCVLSFLITIIIIIISSDHHHHHQRQTSAGAYAVKEHFE
eukprot:326967-Amphidinium_carterae.1